MSSLFDRAMMTVSGTPGTGTITLGSAVLDGTNGDQLSFANAGVPDGATVSYVAVDGHNWGKGRGVYTASGTTLTRDAAEVTWNGSAVGNTPISLTSNAAVFLTAIHTDLPQVTQTLTASSSATLDFTKFYSSEFDVYDITFNNVLPSAATPGWFKMLYSTNGGSTWDTTAANYNSVCSYNFGGNHTGANTGGVNTVAGAFLGSPLTGNTVGLSGTAHLFGMASTSLHKSMTFHCNFYYTSPTGIITMYGGMEYLNNSAVNAVRFLYDTGNIASGTISIAAHPLK